MDCRNKPSFFVTLILLCRNIIAFCRDKDCVSLLEVAGNYVVTYFLCCGIILMELNKLCRDIFLQCRDISSKNPRLIVCRNNYFYATTKLKLKNLRFMLRHKFLMLKKLEKHKQSISQ